MSLTRAVVALLVVVQLGNGFLTDRLARKLHHKRQYGSEEEDTCVHGRIVATAVGEIIDAASDLLDMHTAMMMSNQLGPPGANSIPDFGTGNNNILHRILSELFDSFDPFSQAGREQVFCAFERLETLSQALQVEEDFNLDYAQFRLLYNFMMVQIRRTMLYTQYSLNNPEEYHNIPMLQVEANLFEDLEAMGLMDLDPAGREITQDLKQTLYGDEPGSFIEELGVEIPVVAPSTLSIEEECRILTEDMRLMWNNIIRAQRKWWPQVSHHYRELIKNYTGIEMTDHDTIQETVCNFLEAAASPDNKLLAVFQLIRDMEVPEHLVKMLYPNMQDAYPYVLEEVVSENEVPSYPYGYPGAYPGGYPGYPDSAYPQEGDTGYNYPYPGAYNFGPPPQMAIMYQNLEIILRSIDEMGLLDLKDDLLQD